MASLPSLLPLPQCFVSTDSSGDNGLSIYPIVPLHELCQMKAEERSIFLALVTMLFLVALVGNVCTLYVNARRKLRPFFRGCLIALACSDLLYSLSFTTAYVAHFSARYLQLWVSQAQQTGSNCNCILDSLSESGQLHVQLCAVRQHCHNHDEQPHSGCHCRRPLHGHSSRRVQYMESRAALLLPCTGRHLANLPSQRPATLLHL